MKKTADPKFLEGTVRDAASWAQKHINPQGATNWGDAAGSFWHDHGGKVMGGLGGLAAGALGSAVLPKKVKRNNPSLSWLLPLLAGGAGVAGGHFLSDRKLPKVAAAITEPQVTDPAPKGRPLTRDARPGGRMPNNAEMTKVAFIAKVAFENPLGGVDWGKLWEENKGKIIGGLGGAALGGVGGAMMNGEDDEGETHGVRNGVLGALAGLGLGAGGGYLYDNPEALAKLKGLIGLGDDAPAAAAAPRSAVPAVIGGGAGVAAGAGGAAALRHLRGRNPEIAAAREFQGKNWLRPMPSAGQAGRSKMANIGRLLGYGAIPAAAGAAGTYAGSRF